MNHLVSHQVKTLSACLILGFVSTSLTLPLYFSLQLQALRLQLLKLQALRLQLLKLQPRPQLHQVSQFFLLTFTLSAFEHAYC
jgi:hypothetical protein